MKLFKEEQNTLKPTIAVNYLQQTIPALLLCLLLLMSLSCGGGKEYSVLHPEPIYRIPGQADFSKVGLSEGNGFVVFRKTSTGSETSVSLESGFFESRLSGGLYEMEAISEDGRVLKLIQFVDEDTASLKINLLSTVTSVFLTANSGESLNDLLPKGELLEKKSAFSALMKNAKNVLANPLASRSQRMASLSGLALQNRIVEMNKNGEGSLLQEVKAKLFDIAGNEVLNQLTDEALLDVIERNRQTLYIPASIGEFKISTAMDVTDLESEINSYTKASLGSVDSFLSQKNIKPIADAGLSKMVGTLNPSLLEGSKSMDADGDPLFYNWSQISGETVNLSNSLTERSFFTAPANPGELVFNLVVSDGQSSSLSSTVRIEVIASAINRAPNLQNIANQTTSSGSVVSLNALASDADNDKMEIIWEQVSGKFVTIYQAMTTEAFFEAPSVSGNLIFKATISDGHELTSQTMRVEVW